MSISIPVAQPVSCSLRVAAAPEVVFELLADPRRHPELDGSGTVRGSLSGPARLAPGARFGMSMRYWGIPYRITNRVVEFEPDRRIAWTHASHVIWRYQLEPVPGGCLVTETWDPTPSPARVAYQLLGFPGRTSRAMSATLAQLKALAER